MAKRWNYSGDINLEHGGLFWKEDGSDDYVLAVKVTPCSDGGGPDNRYMIESGSIYIPADNEKRKQALSCIGVELDKATRFDLIKAFDAYQGLERDTESVIQIGKHADDCSPSGFNPEPDIILRGNVRLQRYVRREFLS